MRKMRNLKNHGLRGCHGWILAWRLTQTPYKLDTRFIALYESVLSAESVVSFISVLTKRRFFRSTARLGADPTTASVSIRHSRRCWEGGWRWQAVRRRDLFLQPTL